MAGEIVFLKTPDVMALQQQLVERFGGSAGIRDIGLLESALAQPQSQFGGQYLHATIPEMAAAYLFHLVRNHPFIDGDKRIGAASARVFLLMNGTKFDPSEQEYGGLTLDVAAGRLDKAAAAAFFQQHVKPGV